MPCSRNGRRRAAFSIWEPAPAACCLRCCGSSPTPSASAWTSRRGGGTRRRNAVHLGLADRARFICADWTNAIMAGSTSLCRNPPYITTSEIGALMPEVAHYEPRRALDGGSDGYDAYRSILPNLGAATGRGRHRNSGSGRGTGRHRVGSERANADLQLQPVAISRESHVQSCCRGRIRDEKNVWQGASGRVTMS